MNKQEENIRCLNIFVDAILKENPNGVFWLSKYVFLLSPTGNITGYTLFCRTDSNYCNIINNPYSIRKMGINKNDMQKIEELSRSNVMFPFDCITNEKFHSIHIVHDLS